MQKNIWDNENLINTIKNGGVVVMPTDTIYGILGRAEDESVVNSIYTIRKRNPDKPFIILIANIEELKKFSINISKEHEDKLKEYWSFDYSQDLRPTSVVLDCSDEKFAYLHRGTQTLAFRLPHIPELRELLLKTGPLIAPSANTEALPPSKNIQDAKNYFGDQVDLYVDGGEIKSKASKIIKLHKDGRVDIIRE